MKDIERLNIIIKEHISNPFAATYTMSDVNFNFLIRKAQDLERSKIEYQTLKEINHDLDTQIDQIIQVIQGQTSKTINTRYADIIAILGIETFV